MLRDGLQTCDRHITESCAASLSAHAQAALTLRRWALQGSSPLWRKAFADTATALAAALRCSPVFRCAPCCSPLIATLLPRCLSNLISEKQGTCCGAVRGGSHAALISSRRSKLLMRTLPSGHTEQSWESVQISSRVRAGAGGGASGGQHCGGALLLKLPWIPLWPRMFARCAPAPEQLLLF